MTIMGLSLSLTILSLLAFSIPIARNSQFAKIEIAKNHAGPLSIAFLTRFAK